MTFSSKGTAAPLAPFVKGQGGDVPDMRPLSGVSVFNSLRIYKKFEC